MSRLLGCAVIGAGRIGALHAQTLLSLPHVRLVAVIDPDQQAAVTAAEDRLAATRIDAAFRNPEVDAVIIASPTELHADHIVAAAKAGKAIFCEKPVSLDLARAEEALRVVEETQVPFQIGFQRRYDAGYAGAKARLEQMGRLEMIRLLSSEPAPDTLETLRASGGIFCDMSIHDIDLARFYGGEITTVTAMGACFAFPELADIGDADNVILTLQFASGALGVIENSRRTIHGYDFRTEIQCEHGKLVIERQHATPLRVYDRDGMRRDCSNSFVERFRRAYVEEIAAFVEAVREGRSPTPDARDAVESLRVALAATLSLREGRPVRIDEIATAAPKAAAKARKRQPAER